MKNVKSDCIALPRMIRGMAIDIGRVNFSLYIEEFPATKLDEIYNNFKKIPYKERKTFAYNNNKKLEKIREQVAMSGKRIMIDVKDLTSHINQPYDDEVRGNLLNYLDSLEDIFLSLDVILIEKQYHNPRLQKKSNMDAIITAEFVYGYFFQKIHKKVYMNRPVLMYYPSKYKTELWDAPIKMTKYQRKVWSGNEAKNILNKREDYTGLKDIKTKGFKSDDMGDCLLMWLTFICNFLLLHRKQDR